LRDGLDDREKLDRDAERLTLPGSRKIETAVQVQYTPD
jgi:hypothetical protein